MKENNDNTKHRLTELRKDPTGHKKSPRRASIGNSGTAGRPDDNVSESLRTLAVSSTDGITGLVALHGIGALGIAAVTVEALGAGHEEGNQQKYEQVDNGEHRAYGLDPDGQMHGTQTGRALKHLRNVGHLKIDGPRKVADEQDAGHPAAPPEVVVALDDGQEHGNVEHQQEQEHDEHHHHAAGHGERGAQKSADNGAYRAHHYGQREEDDDIKAEMQTAQPAGSTEEAGEEGAIVVAKIHIFHHDSFYWYNIIRIEYKYIVFGPTGQLSVPEKIGTTGNFRIRQRPGLLPQAEESRPVPTGRVRLIADAGRRNRGHITRGGAPVPRGRRAGGR